MSLLLWAIDLLTTDEDPLLTRPLPYASAQMPPPLLLLIRSLHIPQGASLIL